MGWTTLSVREETAERYNESKMDGCSADEFLNTLLDSWEGEGKFAPPEEGGEIYIRIFDNDNANYVHDMHDKFDRPVEEYLVDGIKYHHDDPEDLSQTDPTQVDPDKLMDKLNTIEAAAKEATNAAQKTQSTVEKLQ